MGQPDRDRLARNYQEYEQMTPEQRARYKRIHAELTEVPLKQTLDEYYAWLKTLTATQRDALRQKTAAGERREAVAKFLDQHEKGVATKGETGGKRGFGRFWPVILSSGDFRSVVGVFEKEIKFDEAETKVVRELSGIARQIEVLRMVAKPVQEKGALKDPEFLKRLTEAVSDKRTREELEMRLQYADERMPVPAARGGVIVSMLYASLLQEIQRSKKPPSSGELQAYFETLGEESQNELLRYPREEFFQQLSREYIQTRGDVKPPDRGEFTVAFLGRASAEELLKLLPGQRSMRPRNEGNNRQNPAVDTRKKANVPAKGGESK